MEKRLPATGAGLAGFGLASSILSTLLTKGIFTQQDVDNIFEVLLSDAEKLNLEANSEGKDCYQMLSALAAVAAGRK
jgi:hypothetical protein